MPDESEKSDLISARARASLQNLRSGRCMRQQMLSFGHEPAMRITRRELLTAGAFAAAGSFARRAHGQAALITPPTSPMRELGEGQNPLHLNIDRDGIIYI